MNKNREQKFAAVWQTAHEGKDRVGSLSIFLGESPNKTKVLCSVPADYSNQTCDLPWRHANACFQVVDAVEGKNTCREGPDRPQARLQSSGPPRYVKDLRTVHPSGSAPSCQPAELRTGCTRTAPYPVKERDTNNPMARPSTDVSRRRRAHVRMAESSSVRAVVRVGRPTCLSYLLLYLPVGLSEPWQPFYLRFFPPG
jgi:hypothetical protein